MGTRAGPAGAAVQVYGADVRDVAAITAVGRACIERQGLPQAVIANAGISSGIDSACVEDLECCAQRLTPTTSVWRPPSSRSSSRCVCAARQLGGHRQRRGIRGLPGHAAYCASKAAVIAYCESLRGECRPFGVRVVTLLPGYVDTPLTRGNPYSMPFLMPPTHSPRRRWRASSPATATA